MMRSEVHFVRLIIRLEQDRARIHDLGVDIATAADRAVVIIEGTVQADGDLGRLGHVDVDVRTQHITAQVDIVVEIVALVDLQQTGIVVERGCDVITGHLSAAAEVGVDTVVDRLVLEEHVPPVNGRIDNRIHPEFRILDLFRGERSDGKRVPGPGRFVEEFHIRDRVGQLQVTGRLGYRSLITDIDGRFAFTAFLGVDQDDAVRTASTVQGSRRRVLHDRESGDVVRLETGQVGRGHLDAVDEDQRAVGIGQGSDAADKEAGIIVTRFAAALIRDQTRDTTGQGCGEVTRRDFQFRRFDRVDGADDGLLLLGAESHDRDFVQLAGRVLHPNDENAFLSHGESLGLLTEEIENQPVCRFDTGQFEGTVQVRDDTPGRTDDGNRRSGEWRTRLVFHYRSLDGLGLGQGRHREQDEEAQRNNFFG